MRAPYPSSTSVDFRAQPPVFSESSASRSLLGSILLACLPPCLPLSHSLYTHPGLTGPAPSLHSTLLHCQPLGLWPSPAQPLMPHPTGPTGLGWATPLAPWNEVYSPYLITSLVCLELSGKQSLSDNGVSLSRGKVGWGVKCLGLRWGIED